MNKELFKQLCLNFNKESNKELHKLWDKELQDYDPIYVEQAVKNIIAKDRFFPTLARIVEEIKNLPCIEISEEEKIKRMKKLKIVPEWAGKEIVNEPIDEETEKIFDDFQEFLEDFRKE